MRTATKLIACACLVCLVCLTANAQERPLTPPVTNAYALQSPPNVDGRVLGDAAWSSVTPATGFWQTRPSEGQPATQRTEVFVGFTDSHLYVGVIAHDDEPDRIVVTDSRRDARLDDSDAFLMIIDGLLDRQNGYVFGTNPAAAEYDGQVIKEGASGNRMRGNDGINLEWDASWRVRTDIGDYGWSAEFEIPFHSLRFGRGTSQDWGINFQRNIRRNNEIAYWSPLDRSRNLYRVSEAGTIRGVMPPSSRNLQITPYALANARRGGNDRNVSPIRYSTKGASDTR